MKRIVSGASRAGSATGALAMKARHLPQPGLGYWLVLAAASIFGCNTGDAFASRFGFLNGLPLLVAGFAAILLLERRDAAPREAWYWLAIVVVRTAATNLADFTAAQVGVSRAILLLAGLLGAALLGARLAAGGAPAGAAEPAKLPRVDLWYWLIMLLAGTLGTAIGDFASFRSGLGLAGASVVLSIAVAAALGLACSGRLSMALFYWGVIVAVRAAGTAVGDLVAAAIGLAPATLATGLLFIAAAGMRRMGLRLAPKGRAADYPS